MLEKTLINWINNNDDSINETISEFVCEIFVTHKYQLYDFKTVGDLINKWICVEDIHRVGYIKNHFFLKNKIKEIISRSLIKNYTEIKMTLEELHRYIGENAKVMEIIEKKIKNAEKEEFQDYLLREIPRWGKINATWQKGKIRNLFEQ